MTIQPKSPHSEWNQIQHAGMQNIADASSVVLEIHKKKVNIKRGQITKICKGLSEIAYSVGQTNDPELYADMIADDIYEAFKQVETRQKKRPLH